MILEELEGTQFKVYVTTVVMRVSSYKNGRTAIECIIKGTDKVYGTLTVNIPDVHLEKDEIIVRTNHENTLIAQEAFATGLFNRTGKPTLVPNTQIWAIK